VLLLSRLRFSPIRFLFGRKPSAAAAGASSLLLLAGAASSFASALLWRL
jgi:hypothetical protein